MEMKLIFVQLCIDVSTWSMAAIPKIGRIQVKRKIVRIMTGIHHGGRRNFRYQRTNVHKLFIVLVDLYLVQSTNDKN